MTGENRAEPRSTELNNYRIEIKLIGQPIYQFRVMDVSTTGAGFLMLADSDFLSMIKIGKVINVNFISPKGSNPSGLHKTEIKHITEPKKDKNKGHYLVGISILDKLKQPET